MKLSALQQPVRRGSQLEETSQRIAKFNNALSSQTDEFKRANNNRAPTRDIQKMRNRLLLPVIVKQPGCGEVVGDTRIYSQAIARLRR